MDLRAPLGLGGDHYLTGVSVGPAEDGRVHDCAGCDGRVRRDRVHLSATVRSDAGDRTAVYHYCSDDCLRAWLAVAAD